jgi:hypothetical protein
MVSIWEDEESVAAFVGPKWHARSFATARPSGSCRRKWPATGAGREIRKGQKVS